jgi:hypothetical protein
MTHPGTLHSLLVTVLTLLSAHAIHAFPLNESINAANPTLKNNTEKSQTAECPETPHFVFPGRPHFARLAFMLTGGTSTYNYLLARSLNESHWIQTKDIFANGIIVNIEHNPLKYRLCVYTSQDSLMDISNILLNGRSKRQTERQWVNLLLGNFLLGNGPENIYLGSESQPAEMIKEATIVRKAVKEFIEAENTPEDSITTYYQKFWLQELLNTLTQPLSLRHFIGSAEIRIEYTNDSTLAVSLINITSITSADITTHLKKPKRWPKSIPRNSQIQPMSNTCQVIQLKIPIEEARRMIQ